jgi:ferritin-like metal-binding protein YciE
MPETSPGAAKLVQYLNEAYGLEKRLETALEAHIAMATQASYKKRLRQHLSETKRHAREVGKRVKALGGDASAVDAPGPSQVSDAARVLLGGAQKAAAFAQGPLHALRGTSHEEKQLKNAKTEYASESEEIATYSAIETLAELVGDTETRRLAREIRREEERMRSYLEKEIPRLTRAVARAEIPASQRGKASRPRRAQSSRRAGGGTSPARRATSRARTPAGSRTPAQGRTQGRARQTSTAKA